MSNKDFKVKNGLVANNYSLPVATSTVYGGVKVSLVGTHLTITA